MSAVDEALGAAEAEPGDVERFVHGMTVGTNALLEERVARTALLATEGFTDLQELGRQARPELYRLCAGHPPPLADVRVPVPERTGPDGVLRELDDDELRTQLDGLEFEAAAVCLLWGFRHPDHERRCGDLVAEAAPDAHVSLSHETAGVFREYERCATTVVDAALSPLLRGYLERLSERAHSAGLPTPEVMLSSGGTADAATAARHGSWTVLSGPAGGAVGAAKSADVELRRARHGRHLLRRVRRHRGAGGRGERSRGGRPGAGAADGGRAHGRRGRRLDRLARPRRCPARRPPVRRRRPRARGLWPRRRGADRDRRQPRARLSRCRFAAGRRRDPRPRRRRAGARGTRLGARPVARRGCRRGRAGRQRRHGPGRAGRDRGARHRPARPRPGRVRRRRAAARGGDRGGARDEPGGRADRLGSAVRARPRGVRAAPRPGGERAPLRRLVQPRADRRRRAPARRARAATSSASRRPSCA